MKKTLIIGLSLIFIIILAVCLGIEAHTPTNNISSIDIESQNNYSLINSYILKDADTGVQYIIVYLKDTSITEAKTIAITPRLNKDGSLYISDK